MGITWKGSPNHTEGREGRSISLIIIHWFGVGTLDGANARFQNSSEDASAHYGISGNTVYQWVKEEDASWAAGNYEFNLKSINIEHDATTSKNMSEETYQTSASLIKDICARHKIPLDRGHIIGHREVVATQCPGTIDIDKLIRLASENTCEAKLANTQEELDEMRESRNKWRLDYIKAVETHEKELVDKQIMVENIQKSNSELTAQLTLSGEQARLAIEEKNATQVKLEASEVKVIDLTEANTKLTNENIKLKANAKKKSWFERLKEFFI